MVSGDVLRGLEIVSVLSGGRLSVSRLLLMIACEILTISPEK